MKTYQEIEEACERAVKLHRTIHPHGSKYPGMTYEDGLRDAFDWIMDNIDEDPTLDE